MIKGSDIGNPRGLLYAVFEVIRYLFCRDKPRLGLFDIKDGDRVLFLEMQLFHVRLTE